MVYDSRSSLVEKLDQQSGYSRRRLLALVTLLSSVLGNASVVVGTALLVRILGGDEFGKVALFTSAAITLGTVTSSGICLHILRITARDISSSNVRVQVWIGTIMGQGIALFITVVLLVAGFLQNDRPLFDYILTGVTLQMTTWDALSKNRLVGSQRLIPLAVVTALGSICTVSLQMLGAWMGEGQGYMVGFALGTCTQAVLSWLACRAALPKMGAWPKDILHNMRNRELLEFVTIATLSACVVPLANWLSLLIASQKMNDYGEVATLTIAMQFFNLAIFVPTILNKLILPKTIKDDFKRDVDESRREAGLQAWRMVLYTAPMLLLVWALSAPITAIYRFPTADGMFVILCFVGASILACATIPLSNFFVSHGKMSRGLVGNLLWAAIYLSLAWMLPGGAISTAISLICAYTINFFIVLYLVKARRHAY